MKLSKENRETVISIGTLLLSIWLFIYGSNIPIRNETFLESARIFPMIVTGIMVLLSLAYVIISVKKSGLVPFEQIKGSVKEFFNSSETRRIFLVILFICIYIFIGVHDGRFYICSVLFVSAMMLLYVKRLKPWVSIIAAIAFVGCLYLLFNKVFMVPII